MKRFNTVALSLLGACTLAVALAFGAIFPQAVAAQDATPAATMDMSGMAMPTAEATAGCPTSTFALVMVAEKSFGFVPPMQMSGFDLGEMGSAMMGMTPEATMMATEDMAAMATEMATAPAMMTADECAGLLTAVTSFLDTKSGAMATMEATAEGTASAMMAPVVYIAHMSGPEEIPGPGDPDAIGTAYVVIRADVNQICWSINVGGLNLPASAAHIHTGAVGVAGGVVVPLTPPDAGGASNGCATPAADVVAAILANPSGFYVNVHNADFPNGALRGNLLGT